MNDRFTGRYFVGDVVQKRGHLWTITGFRADGFAIAERQGTLADQPEKVQTITASFSPSDPGVTLMRHESDVPTIDKMITTLAAGDETKAALLSSFIDSAISQGLIFKR